MGVENVSLTFTDDAIEEIATLAEEINHGVENIGARRLQTVLEKLVEEISFTASERSGDEVDDRCRDGPGDGRRTRQKRGFDQVHSLNCQPGRRVLRSNT